VIPKIKKTLKEEFIYSLLFMFIVLFFIFVLLITPLKKELKTQVYCNISVSIESFLKLSSDVLINDLLLKQNTSIKNTLSSLKSIDAIEYIAAFDKDNKLVYENKKASLLNVKYFDRTNISYFEDYLFMYNGKNVIAFKYDIISAGEVIGSLRIYHSFDKFVSLIKKIEFIVYIFLFSLIFIIFLLINSLLNKLVVKPLKFISKEMQNMNNSILYNKINLKNNNEIGKMAEAFNEISFKNKILIQELKDNNISLEAKIKSRTLELESHNDKLLQTRDSLNARMNEFQALINSTLEALIVFENDKCSEINYECMKLFGFTSKTEVLGKDPSYFISKESRLLVEENSKKEFRSPFEVFGVKKDGEIFCILLKEDLFISAKKKFKILAILDLSEVKKREKTLANNLKLASMGEMLENIAHQWRQPLSSISVAASGMELQEEYGLLDKKRFRESLKSILDNTQQLSLTIDNFRDFFKADSENIIFNLKETFIKIKNLIFSKYENANIKIIFDIEDVSINGNEIELIQIFLNILNNSKDAFEVLNTIENKYVFISLMKEGNFVSINIKDNAKGIKEELLERIFEPFFTTKKQYLSTGTSLYLSREIIVNQFGGSICVKNVHFLYEKNKEVGCEFSIKLPLDIKQIT